MTFTNTAVAPRALVLITGVNGFIGSHIADNLLKAAVRTASVKRFVLTSSNSALLNRTFDMHFSIDRSMWNTIAIENAWRPPPYTADRTWDVYSTLKTQTEQQLWDFQRRYSPSFTINSVLPCFVAGPLLHPKQSGSTGRLLLDFFQNPDQYHFMKEFGASWFIDVLDTALLHIAALTLEDIRNERLLGFTDTFNFNRLLAVFRTLDVEKQWPGHDVGQQHDLSVVDTSREVEILQRLGKARWTSFDESVRRTCLDRNVD